jgi:hypothetical protein
MRALVNIDNATKTAEGRGDNNGDIRCTPYTVFLGYITKQKGRVSVVTDIPWSHKIKQVVKIIFQTSFRLKTPRCTE